MNALARLGSLTLLTLTACKQAPAPKPVLAATPPPVAVKPAPPTPIEEKREDIGGKTWDPQWDISLEKSLPPELLSPAAAHAVRVYCPNFLAESEADKRAFWAYLFQALAAAEAGLDPTTNVRHTQPEVARIDAVTKRTIRQEGLLQLTYQDADRYNCDFDWSADRNLREHDPNRTILQPEKNLACGVKIMENQIITQHKPLLSRTSYWSTLQPGTVSFHVFSKQMANIPQACRVPSAQRKRRPAPTRNIATR